MHRTVADGIELQLARNDPGFLAADVQSEQRGEEAARANLAFQGAAIDIDRLRRGASAINDARNQTLGPRPIGWTLARSLTRFYFKFLNLRHYFDP
jgi:hypothetical protein